MFACNRWPADVFVTRVTYRCVCAEPRERRRMDIVASELCNSSSHTTRKVISGACTAQVLVGDGEFLPFARRVNPQQISTF